MVMETVASAKMEEAPATDSGRLEETVMPGLGLPWPRTPIVFSGDGVGCDP